MSIALAAASRCALSGQPAAAAACRLTAINPLQKMARQTAGDVFLVWKTAVIIMRLLSVFRLTAKLTKRSDSEYHAPSLRCGGNCSPVSLSGRNPWESGDAEASNCIDCSGSCGGRRGCTCSHTVGAG